MVPSGSSTSQRRAEDTLTAQEIASQPQMWRRAVDTAAEHSSALPTEGETVAVVGCGTSWFIARSYAALRESCGHGVTDAFAASEFPHTRLDHYDRVLAITRSGTTTEVIDLLEAVSSPTTTLTGALDSPAAAQSDAAVALAYADEQSVVQTRFATTTLAVLRANLGVDLNGAISDAETALHLDVSDLKELTQITFLGTGWATGLADEAALKCREAAQLWTESYPAMEYRHGPKAIAQPGRAVWSFGQTPAGLGGEVRDMGARHVEHQGLDPMAQLIVAQRMAVTLACERGLNPDEPRNLGRSVVLNPTQS